MIGYNTLAGQVFRCSCCGGTFPESESTYDKQIGAVCKECMINIGWARHWLDKEGIDRPVCKGDANPSNIERFKQI